MKKGNLIFIVGGLGLLYYYYMRNKKNATPVIPVETLLPNVPSQTNVTKDIYPAGLFELDVVANGVETAQLYQGQLRPLTAAYVDRYLPGSWANTKIIPDIFYRSIPRGAVLDI
jgi:hypothetical protein